MYEEMIKILAETIQKLELNFEQEGDGRLNSAFGETEILKKIKTNLPENFSIKISKIRSWCDFEYSFGKRTLFFNLKITSEGTDNVFNKKAFLFTLTGEIPDKTPGNFNNFVNFLENKKISKNRDKFKEYHFLVVSKKAKKKFLIKSLLDIFEFKSNPQNIIQVNWKKEFENINKNNFLDQKKIILKTIQTSFHKYYENNKKILTYDFEIEN